MDKFDELFGEFAHTFDPALRRAFEVSDQVGDLVDHQKVKIHKDSILLSGDRVFYSLQGEGPTMGAPCVFVRLHVCNLACTWCDAFYTWKMDTKEFWTESSRLNFEETAQLIRDTWSGPENIQKRVIWTGGEPLIQRKQIDQVMKLLNGASSWNGAHLTQKWAAEFETNGTLMPTREQLWYGQFNCSPKLANSDNRDGSRIKPKILKALNGVDTTFKFVCMTNEDLDEIEHDYAPHIDHEKIIVMPQGILEEEVSANAKLLVDECKKRGYYLLPRAQNIFFNGARRGV